MTRQLVRFAHVALLVGFVLGLSTSARSQQTPSTPSASKKIPESTLGPKAGGPALNFSLESLTGETVSLSEFRGKVVLLNFWATWVGPCKILTPWLVELQEQYGPQGLQIIGVVLDDEATKAEIGEFADQMRVNYPILIGNEKVATAYGGIPAMPASFFVGRNGQIAGSVIGLKSKGEIEDLIKRALDTPAKADRSSPAGSADSQAQK